MSSDEPIRLDVSEPRVLRLESSNSIWLFDVERMRAHLNNETEAEASLPEQVLVEDEIQAAGPAKPMTT